MYSANDLFGYQSYPFHPDQYAPIEGLPTTSGRRPDRLKIVTVVEEPDDFPNPDDEYNDLDDMLSADFKKGRRLSAQYGLTHSPLSMPSSFSQGDFSLSMSPAASFLSAFSPPSVSTPVPRVPDDEGEVVSGYTLGPVVGYGGFSTIRRASSPSGGTVAVKIVRRSDISKQDNPALERRRLDHEAAVWASLSHEHILPLFSAVHTPYADFFITLYCPAGTLFDILKRDGRPALPQDDTGMMFRQVVRGLRYLHEAAQLVHRDIKLENVLLDETGVCRIGDFGMSRRIGELDDDEEQCRDDELDLLHPHQGDGCRLPTAPLKRQNKLTPNPHLYLLRTARHRHSMPAPSSTESTPARAPVFQPGSLPYAAPELLLPQTSTAPVTPHPAQDIWALGVLLYTLLTGRLPFIDAFEPRLHMKILVGAYDVPEDIGRGAERVLQGCLERSASNRWTIAEVDEVAWGVGWGSEGDDVPTIVTDEIRDRRKKNRSCARSRSSSPVDTCPDASKFQQDGFRPSSETTRGLPDNRAKSSLSRGHALPDRSISTATPSGDSRPPFRLPSITISPSANASPPSSSSSSPAIPTPPSTMSKTNARSVERGRRHLQRSTSRSPSPSVVPTTPVDFAGGHGFSDPIQVMEVPPKSCAESSRGRVSFGRDVKPLGLDHSYPSLEPGLGTKELDILQESSEWTTMAKGSDDGRSFQEYADDEVLTGWRGERRRAIVADVVARPSRRAGSTPPAPWTAKGDEGISSWRFSDPSGMGDRFLRQSEVGFNSTPIPIPVKFSRRRDRSA